jgi:hypothetical protein
MVDHWQIVEAIAAAVATVLAVFSTYWGFSEHQAKKRAEASQAAAEKELKEIRRRGDAPFLKPSAELFNLLYYDMGGGKVNPLPPGGYRGMLCKLLNEVQLNDGEEVIFVIDHSGANARGVSLKLDEKPIALGREADMGGARGRYYLVYPYEKVKHGKEQIISLAFETENGVQDTHRYLTRHGFRVLHRIDPPMP